MARSLHAAGHRLAERLTYRPREVAVVALLAAGLFGGLAIERWRARHPATADRLEAEPVRPAPPLPGASETRPRPRSVVARCEDPRVPTDRPAGIGTSPVPPRLDLNRATPGELARVAGISWRLAARIVAAREAFEDRESRWGAPTATRLAVEPAVAAEPDGPDTESPEVRDTGSP